MIKEAMLNLIDKVAVEIDKEVVVDVVAEAAEAETTTRTHTSTVRFTILITNNIKKFKTIANMDVSKVDLLM